MKQVASEEPLPELAEFLASFAHHFLRSEARENLERYSTGLLSDLPRKNAETIADAVPGTNEQRLQELLTGIKWDEKAFNRQRVSMMQGKICIGDGALIFDDVGFPKKGDFSVGVARQWCPCLGKVANCQVAVDCLYADPAFSWPVSVRLYLPKEWINDPYRCKRAGIPESVSFQTKPQIALSLLDEAREMGISHKVVVADSAYGGDPTFLSGLEERDELYVVGVPCDFQIIPEEEIEKGIIQRADRALSKLPKSKWRTIRWREGTKGWLRKKFVAIRAYRVVGKDRLQLGWLIGERPARGQSGEWKYYFSNLPNDAPLAKMVEFAHRRWHIEQGFFPRSTKVWQS